MYPPIWGPHVWTTIHLMAFSYPDHPTQERQKSMTDFLTNLCVNLPCPGCSIHCGNYVKENVPNVSSRDLFKKWAYDFHNTVNKRTGKRELTYSEAEETLVQKFFQREQWVNLKRAQEMRREDHESIDHWKKLAQKTTNQHQNFPECKNTTTITIGIIASFLLITLIVISCIKYKKR